MFGTNHGNKDVIKKEEIQKIQTEIINKKPLIDKALKTMNGFGIGIRILENIKRNISDDLVSAVLYGLVRDNRDRLDREMTNTEALKSLSAQHAIYCDLIGGLANFEKKLGRKGDTTLAVLTKHAQHIREAATSSPIRSKYISSLIALAENGEEKERIILKNLIGDTIVRSGIYPAPTAEAIKIILSAGYKETRKILLDSLQTQFGGRQSYARMLEAWKTAGPRPEFSIQRNLKAILALEREQPGVVAVLYNNFGICNFGRYPEEMLLAQARDINDKKKPYGVIIYPLTDDNAAFFGHKEIFKKTFQQTQGIYNMRIVEANSKLDVARSLVRLDTLYGDTQKISFTILGGHGSKDKIQLGNNIPSQVISVEDLKESQQKIKEGKKSGISRVKKFFISHAPIVLVSCHTGKEGGPAEHLSQTYETKTTGPSDATWLKAISVKKEDNLPVIEIEYLKTESVTYTNGQKEEKPIS